jgi:hypothetical protein
MATAARVAFYDVVIPPYSNRQVERRDRFMLRSSEGFTIIMD